MTKKKKPDLVGKDFFFTGIFGNTPRNRVWENLVLWRELEFSICDIAQCSKVSRPSATHYLREFMKKKIVVKSGRKYKGKDLYMLNKESNLVKAMIKASRILIFASCDEFGFDKEPFKRR